ncbi:hypothetical protein O181_083219 [Austropuccinia psidii MF-1]|uniref:Ubiquitin-like protease family profile domain-containing protein n=1 Tax=Austropuccinia psidii MF-1 TaxID=1389203 RepID=A0A9Q3ILN4_9BASI|nr:hypothetical protein [Austropuccinia psidii MF-1]
MTQNSQFWSILHTDGDNPRGQLNDDHMYVFMNLGPEMRMQSTLLKQNPQFIQERNENETFIQILHSGPYDSGHWICIWYDTSVVHVYDSMNLKLNAEHYEYLNRLLPNKRTLNVVYEKVQYQKKHFNCGLFSIANAISILNGLCPCTITYDEPSMRSHLTRIFESNEISLFPIINVATLSDVKSHNRDKSLSYSHHHQNLAATEVDMSEYTQKYVNNLSEETIIDTIDLSGIDKSPSKDQLIESLIINDRVKYLILTLNIIILINVTPKKVIKAYFKCSYQEIERNIIFTISICISRF